MEANGNQDIKGAEVTRGGLFLRYNDKSETRRSGYGDIREIRETEYVWNIKEEKASVFELQHQAKIKRRTEESNGRRGGDSASHARNAIADSFFPLLYSHLSFYRRFLVVVAMSLCVLSGRMHIHIYQAFHLLTLSLSVSLSSPSSVLYCSLS